MELNFTKLYDEVASSSTFTKAYKYAVKSRITDLYLESMVRGGEYIDTIKAKVLGRESTYNTALTLSDSGIYLSSFCTCDLYQKNHRPCKHIVALSYYYSEIFGKVDLSKPLENIMKSSIFSEYGELYRMEQSLLFTEKIGVFPYLANEAAGLYVRFKVGQNKLYTIKDIFEFARVLSVNESFRYGDKLEFVHALEAFEERFHPLLRFICAYYSTDSPIVEKSNYRLGVPFKGEIADIIFDLLQDSVLKSDSFEGFYHVKDGEIPYRIGMEKRGELFYLTQADVAFDVISGLHHSYALTGDSFIRLINEQAKKLLPLQRNLKQNHEIIFSREHVEEWFLNVEPFLGDIIIAEYSGFEREEYCPSELTGKLYLDMNLGIITAELHCFYGDSEVDIFETDRKFIIREYELKRCVLQSFVKTENSFVIDGEEEQYDFLTRGIFELEKHFEIFSGERFSSVCIKRTPSVSVGVRVENDLLKLSAGFDSEYSKEEIIKILAAYSQHKKYVKISADTFISLSEAKYDMLSELAQLSSASYEELVCGEINTPAYRALEIDRLLKENSGSYKRDTHFKEMVSKLKNFEDSTFDVGEFDSVLRHYQKVGFRWLKTLGYFGFGGILADDMGLGKSLQTIAFLQSIADKNPSLIVCPSSLILNWQAEFAKFSKSTKTVCVYGNKKIREQILSFSSDYDVLITSYELLRQDIESYEAARFNAVIIDEAQYIKNHGTKNAKAAKSLSCKYRFALTGTPIENNIAELWSIFDFIMPGYLYSYPKFRDMFEYPIVRENDAYAEEKLHKMVSPFILRRLKKTVLKELPQKIENVIALPLENEQKDIYMANLMKVREDILSISDVSKNRVMILSYLLKLRQICCSPNLLYSDYSGNNAKLDAAMELISQSIENGHKVLLFSQFTSMLQLIQTRLKEQGIDYYLLQGDTKKEDRQRLVESFNHNDIGVFLLSLKAGGTGLNLTGADIVIHFDPWWNMSVQNQASDRAHRIGQEKTVQVYKLIVKDTIEESILAMQEKKAILSEKIVKAGEVDFGTLSKDELLGMLGQNFI